MKNLNVLLLMLLAFCLTPSCKKATTPHEDPQSEIPDTFFEVMVTGDQTKNFSITIPASAPQTDFSIVGSHTTALNLLSINAREVPTGFGVALNVTCPSMEEDTFLSNQATIDITSYSSTGSTTFVYQSTSASVTLTKVSFFAEVSGIKSYYVDGTFTATCEDPNDSSKVINMTGSFRGIFVTEA